MGGAFGTRGKEEITFIQNFSRETWRKVITSKIQVKVKVKFSLEQAMSPRGGVEV
jgi:hypothetical protein